MALNIKQVLSIALFAASYSLAAETVTMALPEATLYKDAQCGCCSDYVRYLQQQGIQVKAIDHTDMGLIKKQLGSSQAPSCHTMQLGRYTVEGHVPVASLLKMWAEQPDIKGIALPGMPATSPGMGDAVAGSLRIMRIENDEQVTQEFNVE